MFEVRVLRRISGTNNKTDEAREGWRTLYNKELQNMYSSANSLLHNDKIED
jgi:hypothetical protein